MKCIVLVIFTFLFFSQAFSQTNDSIAGPEMPAGRQSKMIDIQELINKGPTYRDNQFIGHWWGVELGVNGFADRNYSLYPAEDRDFLSTAWFKSNTLHLNLLQHSIGLQSQRNTIGIVTGLGLNLQRYSLDNKTSIQLDEKGKVQPLHLEFDSNQKSILSIVYLEVPLMAEFQVPFKNNFNRLYCSFGISVGRRLASQTKIKYKEADRTEKLKSPGDYAMRDFKFAGALRIGYSWVNLFATYDLTPLFEDERGPVLYPFSAGIKLISF